MTIKITPKKILRDMAPAHVVEKLLTQKLTLNRAVLQTLSRSSLVSADDLEDTALAVLGVYRERYANQRDEGATKREAYDDATNDKRLMVQRVQNAAVHTVMERVRDQYHGERYRWLKSTAAVPDAAHRRKWGRVYRLGRGEAPGERYGCQCGMELLVSGSLELEDLADDDDED